MTNKRETERFYFFPNAFSVFLVSDISHVFLNYSLGIGLHTCLFKFDKRADNKQSAQKYVHCIRPYVVLTILSYVYDTSYF